jgi:alkylhydroperoxidase/carboxymuconolactone decarboxylase family protein YurZ
MTTDDQIDLPETGPWGEALTQLRDLDPTWAETCLKMSTNPWSSGVLSRKLVELIGIALNVAYTNLNADGTRRHIRAALKAGAKIAEVMEVRKLCVAHGVQACNLGVPILAEELARRESICSSEPTPK